jgi:hypothetical protein
MLFPVLYGSAVGRCGHDISAKPKRWRLDVQIIDTLVSSMFFFSLSDFTVAPENLLNPFFLRSINQRELVRKSVVYLEYEEVPCEMHVPGILSSSRAVSTPPHPRGSALRYVT